MAKSFNKIIKNHAIIALKAVEIVSRANHYITNKLNTVCSCYVFQALF